MRQVCHAVDRMGDTRFCLNVRWRSRLCAARAVHVRHPAIPIHVRRRLEKLRHLASVRLTCMSTSYHTVISTAKTAHNLLHETNMGQTQNTNTFRSHTLSRRLKHNGTHFLHNTTSRESYFF